MIGGKIETGYGSSPDLAIANVSDIHEFEIHCRWPVGLESVGAPSADI